MATLINITGAAFRRLSSVGRPTSFMQGLHIVTAEAAQREGQRSTLRRRRHESKDAPVASTAEDFAALVAKLTSR